MSAKAMEEVTLVAAKHRVSTASIIAEMTKRGVKSASQLFAGGHYRR